MLNSTQRSLRNHQHPIGSTALLLRSLRVQIDSVMTAGDREGRARGCKSVYPGVVQDEFKFGLFSADPISLLPSGAALGRAFALPLLADSLVLLVRFPLSDRQSGLPIYEGFVAAGESYGGQEALSSLYHFLPISLQSLILPAATAYNAPK